MVVYDDLEHVFLLPLLTMMGLTYQSDGLKMKEPQAGYRA